jgi:hypothetical protein
MTNINTVAAYYKQALRNMAAVKFRDDSDQAGFEFHAEDADAVGLQETI